MTLEQILPCRDESRSSLRALAERVDIATREPPINIWGNAVEITASHIRIAGLSKFIKLGDWISIETESGGEIAEAKRISAEAVDMAARTDWLCDHDQALLSQGQVLLIAGEADAAGRAMRGAIALYERKGNTIGARRARSTLEVGVTV